MIRMLIVGYCFGIRSERRRARKSISTSGFVGWGWKAAFPTIRVRIGGDPRLVVGRKEDRPACACMGQSERTDGTFSRSNFIFPRPLTVFGKLAEAVVKVVRHPVLKDRDNFDG
jgi:hypothetical protein